MENDETNINQRVKLKNVYWKLKRVIHFGTLIILNESLIMGRKKYFSYFALMIIRIHQ